MMPMHILHVMHPPSLSLIILEMEHVSFNDLLNYQIGHLFLCTLLVKLNCQI
jgi:hypothetical protein